MLPRAKVDTLLDRMDEMRASTPAGIQARAHSLAQHGGRGEYDFGCQDSIVGRLLVYLMRDSAALAGTMTAVPALPPFDTKLLAACVEFQQAEAGKIVSNAKEGWDQAEIDDIGERWYRGLDAILATSAPRTAEGRIALALAPEPHSRTRSAVRAWGHSTKPPLRRSAWR